MTNTPTVLLHTDEPESAIAIVREYHPDLNVHTCDSYEEFPDVINACQPEAVYTCRFAGTDTYPRESLFSTPSVKWVSIGGSGSDHLGSWQPDKVTVTNAAGVAADMMAEYALGCLLTFRLQLRTFEKAQRNQQWIAGKVQPIQGSTALIIGLGKTGCAVAHRFKQMGLTVLGTRANPKPTDYVDEVHSIDELHNNLPRADVIVCAVPLLDSTRNLLDSSEFAMLRSNCVLIDVSRGGVINESALINALDTQQLAGAALDVFATEPLPKGHTLWERENVIITPHCSSVYDGWESRSVAMFAENLKRYRHGDSLHNIVDPTRGY